MVRKKEKYKPVPSFQIDHTRLLPGIYESRLDIVGSEYVTTFDIRMKHPNIEPAVHPNAMHTIEHLAADYLRNDTEWEDRIIYWGPMGCLTGAYLIVKGHPSPEELYPLMLRLFEYIRDYEGEIPGALPANCGNSLLHDLNMAKYEAGQYAGRFKERPSFEYPSAHGPVRGSQATG